MLNLRPEQPQDIAAIHRVNALAFGRPAEADLVDALRANSKTLLSLVAEQDQQIVGHIFFSPVVIDSGSVQYPAVGLAPLAVLPICQRQGIGSKLVQAGLAELTRQGYTAVVVLGHPTYYPRFGFIPSVKFGIRWENDVPENVFMAVELQPAALAGHSGIVRYSPEFKSC
jgi:putative acetyltransferase